MARELAQPVPMDAASVTDDELAQFRATEHGQILASWWGRETPYRLGILCGRMDRLEDTLSDEDLESWQDWINNRLTAEEAAKVLHEAVQ